MIEADLISKWFEKAKNDLICAVHLYKDLYPGQIEISCYHCQQSVEKVLKGYLLSRGIDFPKTHNLVSLCQMCEEENANFSAIMDDCSDLTPYAIHTRYPNEIELTDSETGIAISKATKIFDFTISLIPQLLDKS